MAPEMLHKHSIPETATRELAKPASCEFDMGKDLNAASFLRNKKKPNQSEGTIVNSMLAMMTTSVLAAQPI
jgi:hypothetical protein